MAAEIRQSQDASTHDASASVSDSDSDEDFIKLFSAVIACIHLDRVPRFCATLRQQREQDKTIIEPSISEQPLFGSYHVLYAIDFEDGHRCLLKVPACGTPSLFKEVDSVALSSEARTMQLLRRTTSIPIPEVFAFDPSLDNEIGCPFILMQFVPGLSLADCWFDKKCPPEQLQQRRLTTLKDIAASMAQLGRFSFDSAGTLAYDEHGDPTGIVPSRLLDQTAMLQQMHDEESDGAAVYIRAGPWSTPSAFYARHLDRLEEPNDSFQRGLRRLLWKLLEHIPEPQDSRKQFVFAHPDFDIQNFLVSEDGSLQAIIDWDGVEAVPRAVGFESYPGWLTRDWDPAMYAWNESMEQGIEPEGCWEDSPQTLAALRLYYVRFMRLSLSLEQHVQSANQEEYGRTSQSLSPVQRTANSLYVENLLIATSNPVCTYEIVNRFIEHIPKIMDQDPPEDFTVYDLGDTLADGDLDEARKQYLKQGMETLFSARNPST